MAAINLTQLYLFDRWPGSPNPNLGIPTGGWDNTTDNFSTTDATALAWTPPYPVGTKIQAYTDNSNCPGYYTMMYLMLHCITTTSGIYDATAICLSNGYGICSHNDASQAQAYAAEVADSSWVPYYVVSCWSEHDITRGGPIAIPCATLAGDGSGAYVAGYGDCYGWFWVGGVCPCSDATLLQGSESATAGIDMTTDWAGTATGGRGLFLFEFSAGVCKITGADSSSSSLTDSTAVIADHLNLLPHGFACTSEA